LKLKVIGLGLYK